MSELTALHQPANASDFSPETALYRVGGKLSFIPSLPMIQMRMLELRKRRGLMFTVILLTLGLPVIVLGILEITHLLKPSTYGLPGSPSLFAHLTDPMSLFGFVIGATLGATAGSTDITEGFFRLLVATGRSRISMYFSRMAAGSAIILPLVGLGFTILCLVTCFAGKPQSQYVNVSGIEVPINLSETQLQTWLLNHPNQISNAIGQSVGPQSVGPNGGIIVGGSGKHVNPNAQLPNSNYVNPKSFVKSDIGSIFSGYIYQEVSSINPSNFEMIKVGLWLELVTFMGFIIGLSLGATMGQRTVPTILLLVLQIIITPHSFESKDTLFS